MYILRKLEGFRTAVSQGIVAP